MKAALIQEFSDSGLEWLFVSTPPNTNPVRNALSGLGTTAAPLPMFGGVGNIVGLSATPAKRPNYLESWAVANFGNELQKSFWTHGEIVAILLGINPVFARHEHLALNNFNDPIATEGMRLHEIVQRAILVGELEQQTRPAEVIDWALQRYVQVPQKLLEIAAQRNMPLLNYPTELEVLVAEHEAQTQKLNFEIDHWKDRAKSLAGAIEILHATLAAHDEETAVLKLQLSEAITLSKQLQTLSTETKPKSTSGATREYRTAVKLLYSIVSKNYAYSASSAGWQKKKLEADLAEVGICVNDGTLSKHLLAGSEEASR